MAVEAILTDKMRGEHMLFEDIERLKMTDEELADCPLLMEKREREREEEERTREDEDPEG